METNTQLIIYQREDGTPDINVTFANETVWLNQYQLEELFQTDRTSIVKHIQNIYESNELKEDATCAKIAQVQKEGAREIVPENLPPSEDVKKIERRLKSEEKKALKNKKQ